MNYITRKHLSRRTMLRGLGTAMALPWLDAMMPAAKAAKSTAAAPAVRLAFVYVPNGIIPGAWTPAADGAELRVHPYDEGAGAIPPTRNGSLGSGAD